MMGYALPPQQIVPMATDSRNIVNLLEQSSQPKPPPPQQQHQPPPPIQTMATVSPPMSTLTPSISSTSFQNTPNLLLKTWNSSHNNAPVEKSPPVNVVITSSDPLPPHTTVTQQPTLSVTIPSHHIKNNIVAAAEPASSFTKTQAGHTTKAKSTDTMGVLTFSSTPVTAQATADTASLVDAAHGSTKPNPFASFSFGTSDKPAATMFGVTSAKPFGSQTTEPFGTASPFGGLPKPNIDSPFGWTSTPQPKDGKNTSISLFGGTLSGPVYGKTPETAKPTAAVSAPPAITANTDDDYVPTAYFEPVIPLPDLVETKTGEEDEHIRFEHRAKLLRYVKETNEWKERGIGNMKVLVNKNDANKVRLLMRREQVYKLCCNQLLTKDAKFTALSQSGTALTWCGQDYSDNELQVELLAIRFKTADVCKQFHDAILEAQKNMSADTPSTVDPPKSTTIDAKATGFGAKFKPATGAWDCSACYLSNKPGDVKCMACNTAATESTSTTAVPATVSGFGNMFKPKTGSWECKACYITNKSDAIYCVACESPKDDTVPKKSAAPVLAATTTMKFSFGVPMATTTTTTPAISVVPISSGSFSFGTFTAMTTTTNATAGNMFGAMPPPPSTTSTAAKSALPFTLNGGSFSFGGDKKATLPPVEVASDASASTKIDSSSSSNASVALAPKESFSFVFKPKSPGGAAKAKGAQSVAATEDISDDENIEEENNTYFTPAIPLPDKVDVKTGEEDEHVVYSHRCKLFRFADGEWKERGLGDVKILKHKQSGNLRVVMRREQILKICLNHALTTEIVYNRKDDKTWHFSAMDYSEGEVEVLQFCLRFKTPEIATAFKAAIDKALTAKCSVQTRFSLKPNKRSVSSHSSSSSNNNHHQHHHQHQHQHYQHHHYKNTSTTTVDKTEPKVFDGGAQQWGPTTKPSPRPKKQNKTNKSPPSLPRQKKPAQKKPEGCSSCGAKDHTRRSSKKCANYIKPQRNRFAPQGSSIPNVTWNMKTGFPKFCKERAIFEKINLDVIECSALATEASIYVHWYCMRLLREDQWPVEEYGLNHVLDFFYHLQGKRQAKERVELDESYFAQRQTDRVYDGKLRTFLIQGLAKQYLTVWKNCITVNLCKRLAKYGHLFIDDKMSIYEWRVKIEQQLLSDNCLPKTPNTIRMLEELRCPSELFDNYEKNWWHLIPVMYRMGEWFLANDVKTFSVIPVFKWGRKHLRYGSDALYELLASLKMLKSGTNSANFREKATEYWWKYFNLKKHPQCGTYDVTTHNINGEETTFALSFSTNGVDASLLMNRYGLPQTAHTAPPNAKLDVKDYDVIIGIDPGVKNFIGACTFKRNGRQEKLLLSGAKFKEEFCGERARRRKRKRLLGDFEKRAVIKCAASPKCGGKSEIFTGGKLRNFALCQKEYARRSVTRLKWDAHIKSRRAIDKVVELMLHGSDKRTVVCLGDGSLVDGKSYGRNKKPGFRQLDPAFRRHRKNPKVVIADEYRTSITCSACLRYPMRKPPTNTNTTKRFKGRDENDARATRVSIHRFMVCPYCMTLVWNRDVNAARNIVFASFGVHDYHQNTNPTSVLQPRLNGLSAFLSALRIDRRVGRMRNLGDS